MKKLLVLLAALAILMLAPVLVQGVEQSQKWKSLKFITAEQLKEMIDTNADILLLDTLSPIEFAEEHITGAINIPYSL